MSLELPGSMAGATFKISEKGTAVKHNWAIIMPTMSRMVTKKRFVHFITLWTPNAIKQPKNTHSVLIFGTLTPSAISFKWLSG